MNVAPVIRVSGTVHSADLRDVAPLEASEAERDESGRVTREAREARPGYAVLDVVVHTDQGGYALVLVRDTTLTEALGGAAPQHGERVDWPVRNYVAWAGRPGRRFPTVGYSVAGEILASEAKSTGSRVAAAS